MCFLLSGYPEDQTSVWFCMLLSMGAGTPSPHPTNMASGRPLSSSAGCGAATPSGHGGVGVLRKLGLATGGWSYFPGIPKLDAKER